MSLSPNQKGLLNHAAEILKLYFGIWSNDRISQQLKSYEVIINTPRTEFQSSLLNNISEYAVKRGIKYGIGVNEDKTLTIKLSR